MEPGGTPRAGLKEELGLAVQRVLEDLVLVGDKVQLKNSPERVPTPEEPAHLKASFLVEPRKAKVGEDVHLRFHVSNVGDTPVFLTRIEETFPSAFELVAKPDYSHSGTGFLDLNKRRLNPAATEDLHFTFLPLGEGTFSMMPKIRFFNGIEQQTHCEPCCATVEIQENLLPGRVKTGHRDLDNLLLGGIPENYAMIMTSASSDERELLIKRFLETALKAGEATFYFTIDAFGVKALTEEFPESFFVFLCNPQADAIIPDSPNVYKLKGVDNLTDINIALTSAFRALDEQPPQGRRACIGIVSDILLQYGAVQTRRWLTGLVTELRSRGFTTLGIVNPYMHRPEEVQAVLDLFEGEISIFEERAERFLQIKKLYNQTYLENRRPIKKMSLTTEHLTRRGKWQRY